MNINVRRDRRRIASSEYSISWQDESGLARSAQVKGRDFSDGGVGFESAVDLRPGTVVFIQGPESHPNGYGTVRHCTRCDQGFLIGLELNEEAKTTLPPADAAFTDYYELLQIDPNAEPETILRVHRFLAARYHPDNPATGDPEKFLLLQRAYETLSDPVRRDQYNATRKHMEAPRSPISAEVDFMDGMLGETNRRLALLSLLYNQRRASSNRPEVTLAEIEDRMGFPRDYLDFTLWYLKSKKYITMGDNADLSLTVLGVDYVESNCMGFPLMKKLLTSSSTAPRARAAASREDGEPDEPALLATHSV